MAWDWKPGERRDYTSAREALKKEQSKSNFKEMIKVCQQIIEYHWDEAKDMDEYADLVQVYEKTVLSFWKKYKTLESLYHIVYFYCDRAFTEWIYGLDEPDRRLEHLKRGILYTQLYHEKVNRDYSAVFLLRLYRILYETKPSEGLDFLRKACQLAKEWTYQWKTPLLLEEYALISGAAAMAVDEVEWKSAEEKKAAGQEFVAVLEDYRAAERDICFFPAESQKEEFPAEWELFDKLDCMRREALSNSRELFAGHRKEIYHCIEVCMHLQQAAHYEGLKPLLSEGKKLEKSSRPYCRLLAYGIKLIGKVDYQEITKQMMERFGGEMAEDTYTKYIMYLCTRFIESVYEGYHMRVVRPFLLSCVPAEEHDGLLKYLGNIRQYGGTRI